MNTARQAVSTAPFRLSGNPQGQLSWLLLRLGEVAGRGEVCPPTVAFAAELRCSDETIKRLFARLQQAGVIRVEGLQKGRVVTIVSTGAQTARPVVAAPKLPRRVRKVLLPDAHCPHCGVLFRPTDKRQEYCTKPCKVRAWRAANPLTVVPPALPHDSPLDQLETGVRPAPTLREMPRNWREYRYEDHPEAARRYEARKSAGHSPNFYPHRTTVQRGDSVLGDL